MLPDFIHTLLSSTWGIVLMLLFFNGSIVIHELGHYLAARWRGLKVTRFSIFGLGPKLISWRGKNGVEYCICALPFGAYVALPQLAEMKAIEGDDESAESLPPISYADKMIVAGAGPLFNLIFAVLLAAIVWSIGYPQPASSSTTTIGYVAPELTLGSDGTTVPGPAYQAGLRAGDVILSIDGTPIRRFAEVTELIALGSGRDASGNPQAELTVKRGEQTIDITVLPRLVTINDSSGDRLRLIGISPAQAMIVGNTSAGSPAQKAGVQAGDHLLSANGEHLYSVAQFADIISQAPQQPASLLLERDGKEITLEITPQPVPLTRPLLNLFTATDDKPVLEIIPLYTQQTVTNETASLASADTPARLSLHSMPEASGTLSGHKGQWFVTAVNGKEVNSLATLQAALKASEEQKASAPAADNTSHGITLSLTDSKGATSSLALPATTTATLVAPQTRTLVGFEIAEGHSIAYPTIGNQFSQHLDTMGRTLRSLFSPSSNIGIGHLSGPVGIGRAVYSLAVSDIRLVLWFTVFLNINLAILNLLPIPVLDGGHMMIATLTKIFRRPMPESFIVSLQSAFMFALLGLMVYILFKDSMRWHGDSEAERHWQRQSLYRIPVQFNSPSDTPAEPASSPK